jgi:hypothetical protein
MSQSEKSQECLSCKQHESGSVTGASYVSNGDNGMVVSFWMCDACAMKLGPGQGPIDMDEAPPPENLASEEA